VTAISICSDSSLRLVEVLTCICTMEGGRPNAPAILLRNASCCASSSSVRNERKLTRSTHVDTPWCSATLSQEHAWSPVVFFIFPAAHCPHSPLSVSECVCDGVHPALHAQAVLCGFAITLDIAGHCIHAVAPVVSEYDQAWHVVQESANSTPSVLPFICAVESGSMPLAHTTKNNKRHDI